MKLAVRTTKHKALKRQFLALLDLRVEDISAMRIYYQGILLPSLEEKSLSTCNSTRNSEVLLLYDAGTTDIQPPSIAEETPSFQSSNSVAAAG